jgi:hypothetical protein
MHTHFIQVRISTNKAARGVGIVAACLALAALLAGCQIVPNGDFTLHTGETISGPLIVTSGNATLETGSRVRGPVLVASGHLEANGLIDGNVWVTSGDAFLGPTADVRGGVTAFSGEIQRMPGAQVEGRGGGLLGSLFGLFVLLCCLGPLLCCGSLILIFLLISALVRNRRRQ